MASPKTERRPLAPTSINAILASPLPSPAKSATYTTTTTSTSRRPLLPPPFNLNQTQPSKAAPQIPCTLPLPLSTASQPNILPPIRQPLPNCATHPVANILPTLPSITTAHPTKRKASDISTAPADEDVLYRIPENCDQIRRKIQSFINSGEMKVTEFQRQLACNSNSYSRFMGQNGQLKGVNSDVYGAAFRFFRRRELQGIKIPVKKVKREDEVKQSDVSAIRLDGEDTVSVEVYDSCNEIRKKIRAHLTQPSVTQAGFLREIAKTYPDGRKIQSKVLNDFLGKRGIFAGNTSAVYYSSYVFFEKMRIRDGKPKSKHRTEMETAYKDEGGIDVKHRDSGKYCFSIGE